MEGQNGGNEPTNPQNSGGASTPAPENGDIFNGGAGLGGGGIYSNPDLTIDKDAIPEEVSNAPVNPPAGDAGRVAAAFANTDASQKAAMTPSIVGPTATQSTATGDIKLARGPRPKRSKAPFIIIGIGVVAIAVIVVVLMGVMRGEDVTQAFMEYYDYAQELFKAGTGDEAYPYVDDEGVVIEDVDEELAEDIDEDDYDDESEDDDEDDESNDEDAEELSLSGGSIKELRMKFDVFKLAVDTSRLPEDIKNKVAILNQYIGVAERVFLIEDNRENAIETYRNGGEESVLNYIDGMVLSDEKDPLYAVSEMEADYFANVVGMYVASEGIGCANEGEIDYDCVTKYYKDDGFWVNSHDSELTNMQASFTNRPVIRLIGQSIMTLNKELKTELESD